MIHSRPSVLGSLMRRLKRTYDTVTRNWILVLVVITLGVLMPRDYVTGRYTFSAWHDLVLGTLLFFYWWAMRAGDSMQRQLVAERREREIIMRGWDVDRDMLEYYRRMYVEELENRRRAA